MRTTLILLATLAQVSIIAGCKRAQAAPGRKGEIVAAFKGPFKHETKIESDYDKFKDFGNIYFETRIKDGPLPDSIRYGITTIYSGQKPAPPYLFRIDFFSISEDWKFLNSHSLICIIDGSRHSFGELSHDGNASGGIVTERMFKEISPNELLLIANAKKVECQIGIEEFSLNNEAIETTRDLISKIQTDPTSR